MTAIRRALFAFGLIALIVIAQRTMAQEAVMEEVRVEASSSSSLELSNDRAVDLLTLRLRARAEAKREFELQLANRSALTSLLGLTKAIPIPLGGSENRVDTFFQQNYMRTDLNPSKKSSIFDSK